MYFLSIYGLSHHMSPSPHVTTTTTTFSTSTMTFNMTMTTMTMTTMTMTTTTSMCQCVNNHNNTSDHPENGSSSGGGLNVLSPRYVFSFLFSFITTLLKITAAAATTPPQQQQQQQKWTQDASSQAPSIYFILTYSTNDYFRDFLRLTTTTPVMRWSFFHLWKMLFYDNLHYGQRFTGHLCC